MKRTYVPDRSVEQVNSTKKIVPAGLFARTVAAIVDLAIVAFIAGLFFIGGQYIMERSSLVLDSVNEMRDYYITSGLLRYEEKDGELTNELVFYKYDNYKDYENLLVNYFTVYKTSECPEQYRDDKYTTYWYNVHILGLAENPNATPFEQKDLDARPDLVKEKGSKIFKYDDTLGEDMYSSRPVLNFDPAVDGEEELIKNAALRYYFIAEESNENNDYYVYSYAVTDLMSSEYFNNAYTTMFKWYYVVPILVSALLSALIFYFIIPIITKNGQTLGKMTMSIALVNKLGYSYSKKQLIPRFFFNVVLIIAMYLIFDLFPHGWLILLGAVTIYFFASYTVMVFTKDHKAIHDYFAATMAVNTKESVWFKDANEEARIQKRIEESGKIDFDEKLDKEKNPNLLYVNPKFKNPEKGDSGKDDNED